MFHIRKRGPSPARREVLDDWLAVLPREQSLAFDTIVRQWECSYAMMGVALDDALSLRTHGELVCARQQLQVTTELMRSFAGSLIAACRCIMDAGKHLDELPIVKPLKTRFFRGDTGQSAASWNGLLHHLTFGHRSRFFHKLRILTGTFEQLGRDFDKTAGDLTAGVSVQPAKSWTALDYIHYDLNTCLREAEVLLKAFLRALPAVQLPAFATEMSRPPAKKSKDQRRLTRISA